MSMVTDRAMNFPSLDRVLINDTQPFISLVEQKDTNTRLSR